MYYAQQPGQRDLRESFGFGRSDTGRGNRQLLFCNQQIWGGHCNHSDGRQANRYIWNHNLLIQ